MPASRNLDLHLLRTLDHLLRERSVTAAAQKLGVSQPAVSVSLAKLRRHFDDQLLVREDGQYVLTPLAAELAARTPAALAEVRSVFDAGHDFDPASTSRTFTLAASDYFGIVHGPALVSRLSAEAPGATLRLLGIGTALLSSFGSRLLETDGVVLPRASIPDYPALDVAEDEWCFVACRRSTVAARGLKVDDLAGLPWVVTRFDGGGHVPPLEHLHSQGLATRLEIVTSDFASVPFLVAGTERLGLVQRSLAELLSPASQTTVLTSPLPLPTLLVNVLWHPAHNLDPGHRWFRNQLVDLTTRERLSAPRVPR